MLSPDSLRQSLTRVIDPELFLNIVDLGLVYGIEVNPDQQVTVTMTMTTPHCPMGPQIIKDVIADAFLQQILLRPAEYSVIATLNLNGDYISDALAAMVGGIGIAPGANINYISGKAIFEATHGTAPKYAGLDKVNPSSVILSGVMMFEYMGWKEAGNLIIKGLEAAIASKRVTYDLSLIHISEPTRPY